jgi:hypothetical protein
VHAAYFTASSSRLPYFSFLPLVFSSTCCKVANISKLWSRNYDLASQLWINLFPCRSAHTVLHTLMEGGWSRKIKISTSAQECKVCGRYTDEFQDFFCVIRYLMGTFRGLSK